MSWKRCREMLYLDDFEKFVNSIHINNEKHVWWISWMKRQKAASMWGRWVVSLKFMFIGLFRFYDTKPYSKSIYLLFKAIQILLDFTNKKVVLLNWYVQKQKNFQKSAFLFTVKPKNKLPNSQNWKMEILFWNTLFLKCTSTIKE